MDVKEHGFESEQELHQMVAQVDISDIDSIKRFKDWQNNDGTKEGLQEIIDEQFTDDD